MNNFLLKSGFLFLAFSIYVSFLDAQIPGYNLETNFTVPYTELKNNFSKLPSESRLRCYWWWLNSMATKESITRDLEQMKAKGYGGASLVDAGSSNYDVALKTAAGPVFMSSAWMELYKYAVKEADRVGIELSVNVQSGWNPGGPSITPEFAMKKFVWTEMNVTGGKRIKLSLPNPEFNLWYSDIIVQAVKKNNAPIKNDAIQNWDKKSFNKAIGWKGIYPLHELKEDFPDPGDAFALKASEIIDISKHYNGNILDWNAPSGEWTIIRYGYTCTGATTSTTSDGWNGLSLDHLSADAFELFSKNVIIPLIKTAQAEGKSLKFLQTDSWEMNTVSWTKYLAEEFKKFRGYNIWSYLPVLTGRIVENRDVSNRFLHDYRKTIGDCVENNHYRLFYNLAHQFGLGIHPESGGPHSAPVDALKVMAISDFPQGEFWAMANTHRINDDERLSVRQSACAAHTNGKRFVAAEGPTSIGPQWERSPKDLKGNIDRVFCSGVNRIVWHTFTSSPKEFGLPGNEYFAGTHLNPNVTWWEQSVDFIKYLNRCSYILQQGLFVADVLYYYGDDVPNFVFLKEELPELKFGYDWDKCSKDVILNRLSFENGKILLPDGMNYRLMMLPPLKSIDLSVLRKLETLVNHGMTLIGPKPESISGLSGFPQSDKELKSIVNRMWGDIDGKFIFEHNYGKGKIIWKKSINEVLADMNVLADFDFKSSDKYTSLDFIHRSTSDQEIYFVSNRYSRKGFNDFKYRYIPTLPDRYEQVECSFRVSGMIPEIWNAVTGKIEGTPIYFEENGVTTIPLHFAPEESKIIVFRKSDVKANIVTVTKDKQLIFPGKVIETNEFPMIDTYSKGDSFTAVAYQPGEYLLSKRSGETEKFKAKAAVDLDISKGNWDIRFNPNWGAPSQILTDSLKSWTEFEDVGIKYYSGTATYLKTFTLENIDTISSKWILDLGNVQEMASIKLNGQQLQVLWCAPFQFDITSTVRKDQNLLEVEVVNMWVNRLIGDGKLPIEKRRTKTNIIKFNGSDADQYLKVSGLLGPVRIMVFPKFHFQ